MVTRNFENRNLNNSFWHDFRLPALICLAIFIAFLLVYNFNVLSADKPNLYTNCAFIQIEWGNPPEIPTTSSYAKIEFTGNNKPDDMFLYLLFKQDDQPYVWGGDTIEYNIETLSRSYWEIRGIVYIGDNIYYTDKERFFCNTFMPKVTY